MLLSQGKKDEAEALLQKLQIQFPSSADAAMAIGDFYLALNKSESALSEYRRALSDSPKNLDIKKRIFGSLSGNQPNSARPPLWIVS